LTQKVLRDFVHLHVHSHYSLLDGACLIDRLISTAKSFGMKALALTDHGNLFGAIEFYRKAIAAGVKPIIGYEAYLAPGGRRVKDSGGRPEASFHLTLLARNIQGYKNLLKIASIAYLEGFYYRPRIDREILEQYHEGLVCLSGCLSSEISTYLKANDRKRALESATFYRNIFGKDHFFLELQDTGIPEQRMIREGLLEIADALGLKVVATNDVHYIKREDAQAHDVLLCINTGKALSDENRLRMPTDEFYFKSAEEMAEIFKEVPDALANTKLVADICNLELSFEEKHLPLFRAPDGRSNKEYLAELCEEGLRRRYGEKPSPELRRRLENELEIIHRSGYDSYFLIVWDFVRFAQEKGIPVGPGRGSAAGSIVAYCLGITNIDPIRYGLLFERFLDESRKEMPDIDIDFCQDRRAEVIQYVRQKYGEESVAQIITFGTMAARGIIRDVGRVLEFPYAEVDRIAKLVPATIGITLRDALQQEPELARLYESDSRLRQLFDIARKLEGLARHASIHAAGVVISDRPLVEYVPLYKTGTEITTQYPMDALEQIGLLKMDFLGLKTLTVLDKAVKLIERTHGKRIDLDKIPLDDAKTYQIFSSGQTKGVFQFESSGFRELLQQMKPDRFEDIIAAVALYRPGPLRGGVVRDYIERKHGSAKTPYSHEVLKDVLEETYGVMIYQEQVMRILNRLAGIELGDAYTIVKAISKKRMELINSYRETFVEGAAKKNLSPEKAQEIFQLITYFGGYGFNKSHSAAYALISYQTAYLKAHYPVEFMAALLSSEIGNSDKVASYVEECKRLGIKILKPDVNEGYGEFTVQGRKIRFGLAAVKNVGTKAIDAIVEARSQGGPFKDLFDFCERVDLRLVNRAVIESLIKCGAFDSTGASRQSLWISLDDALRIGAACQRDRNAGQLTLLDAFDKKRPEGTGGKMRDLKEWPKARLLSYEKEALGFYISGHPLARHREVLEKFSTTSIQDLEKLEGASEVIIGGMISSVRYKTTKNGPMAGQKMALFKFEDLTGSAEGVMFASDYEKTGRYLKRESIVFLRGRVDFREEKPNLKTVEVIPFEEVFDRFNGKVAIRIPSAKANEETLSLLREICAEHPGKAPLRLEVDRYGKKPLRIAVDDAMGISPESTFIEKVTALLGKGSVRIVGGVTSK